MSMDTSQTDLYRYFDRAGRLLYVGISFNAVARASQHRAEKHWWADVANMTVERHPTRSDALMAESMAINKECPMWNIAGNKGGAAKETALHYVRGDNWTRECHDLHLKYEINGSSIWKELDDDADVYVEWIKWMKRNYGPKPVSATVGWYVVDEGTGLFENPPEFLASQWFKGDWEEQFGTPRRSDGKRFAWWQLPIRNTYPIFEGIEWLRPAFGQLEIAVPDDWEAR